MRVRLVCSVALVTAGFACLAAAAPSVAASDSVPRFHPVKLAGSNGFSEPRAAVLPDGTRYVDTNQAQSGAEIVYRSVSGLAWKKTATDPSQMAATTDVDIVATQTGRLVASELDDDGINFITAYSDDQGAHWTRSQGTTYADTDRQWLAVGPIDKATKQPYVYLLFHNLLSGLLNHNMYVMTSTDGGATFGLPVPITRPPQQDYLDLQCADSGGPSNIFYDKKTNRVYAVFGTRSSPIGGCGAQPVEVNVVAANRVWVVDAPATQTATLTAWSNHLAVNDTGPPAHIVGMQLAPAASDTAGNVYVAYPESIKDYPDYNGGAIKVVHAAPNNLDQWSQPSVVEPSGGAGNVLPHIIAGDPGRVDVAYYRGTGSGSHIGWYSYMAESLNALSADPTWTHVPLSPILVEPHQTASQLMGACLSGAAATLNGFACGRAADVYGIADDACGNLLVTWPAQAGLRTDGTYVAQQTGGSRLLVQCSSGSTGSGGGGSNGGVGSGKQGSHATRNLASSGLDPLLPASGLVLLVVAAVSAGGIRRNKARVTKQHRA